MKGHNFDGIKILGDGAVSKPLDVRATRFSQSAIAKIAAAGGQYALVAYSRRQRGAEA